jgi:ketosteroid isomerase-like protein
MTRTNREVAEAWLQGLASGDYSGLQDLANPDMRTWHSSDNVWMSRAESEARIASAPPSGVAPSFGAAKLTMTESGFVVQGKADLPGMGPTHILQLLTVDDGEILSIEEYLAPELPIG